MSEAFSAFVSHLECSETGEQYPANQAYNVSNAGYPLLVRYDLNALRDALKPRALSSGCLLYTSPSPRDLSTSRMPSSA